MLVSSNSMREGHGRGYMSWREVTARRTKRPGLRVLSSGFALTYFTHCLRLPWVGKITGQEEWGKQAHQLLHRRDADHPCICSQVDASRGSHCPILPGTLGASGKVEMGYSHSPLSWSAFQPGITTLCTWSRPGHTPTAWPKSPNRSWFKFSCLSQENLARAFDVRDKMKLSFT